MNVLLSRENATTAPKLQQNTNAIIRNTREIALRVGDIQTTYIQLVGAGSIYIDVCLCLNKYHMPRFIELLCHVEL